MLSDLEEAFRSWFIVDDGRNELQNSTKQESAFDNSAKTVAVSGGTFSSALSVDLCAEGCAPVNNGDGTYGVKLAESAYLLQDYRTGDQASWTYPTKDGKAFTGWYKDAAFTTACTASDVEGAAYAKFVNITDLLQYKGGLLRMDAAQPSELTWLRFVARWLFPKAQALLRTADTSRRFRHLSRRMFAGWQTTMF